MLEELQQDVEKVNKIMYEQNVTINKEIEHLTGNQNTILDLKSTMTEIKNVLLEGRLSRQKKESTRKTGQWKSSSLRNRKKKE